MSVIFSLVKVKMQFISMEIDHIYSVRGKKSNKTPFLLTLLSYIIMASVYDNAV